MTQPITTSAIVPTIDPVASEHAVSTIVDAKTNLAVKAQPTPEPKPAEPPPVYTAPSATRLLVERGTEGQAFVYKLVSRTTGEILSEFPREAARSLASRAGYTAGAIIDESA